MRIVCLEGELQGSEVIMQEGQSIRIGRDAKKSNLVFRDLTISRIHCEIECMNEKEYRVTNYSSNVLEMEGGSFISAKETKKVNTGAVLLIGSGGTKIQLN